MSKKDPAKLDSEAIVKKLEEIEEQLAIAQEQTAVAQSREQRAMADYQNLVRRTQEDKVKIIKFAGKELISDLLEPLSNLELASQQINDQGLTMIIKQIWDRLNQHGLEKLDVMGQQFDVETMEVSELESENGQTVVKVVSPGYRLNGEVIQHAKVVLGKTTSTSQGGSNN